MKFRKPPLRIQPTTLWDYPSQHYGDDVQGDPNYRGATPSYIIWNLLQRYTKERDLVVDPCAGSGTTLDVARDLNRKALGYDIHPTRKDIFRVDARKLPPELTNKVDFVFIDPPTRRTSTMAQIRATLASSMLPGRNITRRWSRSSLKFTAFFGPIATWRCT